MLNLRRSPLLAVMAAVLVTFVSVGRGQENDSGKAQASLRQGIAQFNALEFKAAKQTLMSVNRSALPDADKTTLDTYIEKVDPAVKEQSAAMASYRAAETALKDGDLAKAKEGFAAAAASASLQGAVRQDAKAQLAVVEKKMAGMAEVAAALEEKDPAAKVATTQAVAPVAVAATQPAGEAAAEKVIVTPAVQPAVQPVAAGGQADESVAKVPVVTIVPATVDGAKPEAVAIEQAQPAAADVPAAALADAPAEADLAVAGSPEENRQKAEELVALGQKALDENQADSAVAYFQRALALDPNNPQAMQQLDYASQMSTTAGEAGILSRLERNRRIARQSSDVEYDKAMSQAVETLAQADTGAQFDSSVESARVARNVLEANKGLYTEAEYSERLVKVDDQISLIEQRREEWSQQRVQSQVAEIKQREDVRRQQETERRDRKVAELKERARVLRSEGKYELALEVAQQILNIDPTDSAAAEQVEVLKTHVLLQTDREAHQDQREQETRQDIGLRQAEIPWYEMIKYPTDWKDLTKRREPFGADVGSSSPQADRELRQLMSEKLTADLVFEDREFKDVIDFLREITNTNIVVKWTALSALAIDQTTPVNVILSNVTFEKALRVILDYVGGAEPLSYLIDGGVITISTRDDLASKTYTDVYDIRDLIVRVPNFAAPRIDLASAGQTTTTGNGGGGGGVGLFGNDSGDNTDEENIPTRGEIVLNIISLIQETIDPLSWQTSGGLVGSIREMQGQLVVTQTSANHQALMNLIRKLREARALQVSIEARFIAVNTGFLNSIGLDLDFFFNLGSRLGSTHVTDPFTGASVPTTAGQSGWGSGKPGNSKFTPMGVNQNSLGFTSMVGASSPVGAGSIGGQVDSPGMTVQGTFLDDIQVNFLMEATQAHSSTRSLTAPRLTLFNGQRAYVAVATQQSYIADLEPIVADNAVSFNPVPGLVASGAVLDVEASISADRRYVTLTVRPQVTNVIGFRNYAINQAEVDENGNPIVGSGFVELPTISVQELQTTVSVPDGGTLLLGGQMLSGEVEHEMGVPLLNKIPVLNRAFSNRGTVRDEQTLLILIKPKIIIQREEEERQFPD